MRTITVSAPSSPAPIADFAELGSIAPRWLHDVQDEEATDSRQAETSPKRCTAGVVACV
jgi:hypothetical protein